MSLAWLFVLKIYSVTYLEGWWLPVHGFMWSPEAILPNVFLAMAKANL